MTDANATERRAGSAADWEDAVAVGPPWSALVDLRVLPPRGPNRADSPTPHPSQRRQSGCARTHFSFLSFSFYPRPLNGRSTVVTDSPVSQSEKERKNSLPTAAAPSASSRCLSLDLSHSLRRENVLSLASSQARSAATSTPRRSRLCCAYTCHHAPISSLPLVAMSHISVVFLLFSFVFFIYIYIYIYIYISLSYRVSHALSTFFLLFFFSWRWADSLPRGRLMRTRTRVNDAHSIRRVCTWQFAPSPSSSVVGYFALVTDLAINTEYDADENETLSKIHRYWNLLSSFSSLYSNILFSSFHKGAKDE